jgi:NTP pyrophosphatase (non-canonical NTP hydrolase)
MPNFKKALEALGTQLRIERMNLASGCGCKECIESHIAELENEIACLNDRGKTKGDGRKAITDLVKEAHQNAVEHGWWDGEERNFGELLMLVVGELSETHNEYRNNHALTETYYSFDGQGNRKMEGIPSELADTVIRIMDICGQYGIDLEAAVAEKMAYNKTRPYRHGGKKC